MLYSSFIILESEFCFHNNYKLCNCCVSYKCMTKNSCTKRWPVLLRSLY